VYGGQRDVESYMSTLRKLGVYTRAGGGPYARLVQTLYNIGL